MLCYKTFNFLNVLNINSNNSSLAPQSPWSYQGKSKVQGTKKPIQNQKYHLLLYAERGSTSLIKVISPEEDTYTCHLTLVSLIQKVEIFCHFLHSQQSFNTAL